MLDGVIPFSKNESAHGQMWGSLDLKEKPRTQRAGQGCKMLKHLAESAVCGQTPSTRRVFRLLVVAYSTFAIFTRASFRAVWFLIRQKYSIGSTRMQEDVFMMKTYVVLY